MRDDDTDSRGRDLVTEPHSTVAEFRRGLLESNLASVGIALLVCAGLVAALALVVDESFAASPRLQYFSPPRGAHAIAVTSHVLRLSRERPEAPQVLVLGSSAVRNSVDTVRLQERLRREGHADVEVVGLATAAQPIALSRAMLERVPRETTGVVVLGFGMRQFATESRYTAELGTSPRLGFRSAGLDASIHAAGGEVPSRIGVYAWDNRNYLAPRLLGGLLPNLLSGPPTPVLMPHAGKDAHPVEHYDRMLAAVAEHLVDYAANAPRNAAELARLVAEVVARPGLDLVLIEATVNPEFVTRHGLEEERVDCLERVVRIAERHGVPLLRPGDLVGLVPEDFRDAVHLRRRAASARYTDVIADVLAARLARRGK